MKAVTYAVAVSLMLLVFEGWLGAENNLVEKGKAIVEKKHCTICHKDGGKGKPMAALVAGNSDSQLERAILHPKETIGPKTLMPTYKLANQEVQAVIEYLHSISEP